VKFSWSHEAPANREWYSIHPGWFNSRLDASQIASSSNFKLGEVEVLKKYIVRMPFVIAIVLIALALSVGVASAEESNQDTCDQNCIDIEQVCMEKCSGDDEDEEDACRTTCETAADECIQRCGS
jgi:hypothetical protein